MLLSPKGSEGNHGYWSSLNGSPLAAILQLSDDYGMDVNTLAFKIVQQSIGEEPIKKIQPATAQRGLKRAASLTSERRTEIAKKAAAKRWQKSKTGGVSIPLSPPAFVMLTRV